MNQLLFLLNFIYYFIDEELKHRDMKQFVHDNSADTCQRQSDPSCLGPEIKIYHFIQMKYIIFNVYYSFINW